ncbi:S9 family peptidase, partial [Corynebacterium striatum]
MTELTPPIAAKHPITRQFHGRSFVDDYEWMRDKESAETLDYLRAENAYTEQETAHLKELTENIFQEVKSRVKETDMSVPSRRGQYWYYGRSVEGKNYGISCRVPVAEDADPWTAPVIPEEGAPEGEEILLDANELAEGTEFFAMGASTVSDSGNLLAYSVDTAGDERFSLVIKDLRTGELLSDRLDGIFYGATWVGDDYIFYTTVDDAWRPDTVWRHKVGTEQSEDVQVMHEADEHFNIGVGSIRSEKYLFIVIGSKLTSETWVLDRTDPEGEFQVLWQREAGVDYDVDYAEIDGQAYWFVTHNASGPNFTLVTTPLAVGEDLAPLRELDVLIPHREDVRLEGVDTYRDQVVVGYRRGGIGRAAIMDVRHGWSEFKELNFNEELYTVSVGGNPEWDAPVLRVSYTSFIQPSQLFDYRVETGEYTLLKEQEVPGGYNKDDYVAYRMWTQASDGTQIPVSIVHRADLDRTKANPTLLYGYGSYETSMDPYFSVFRLSLMDRDMIFAMAHVRGGGEMGRTWYDDGKLLQKKNTFTDF